MASTTTIIEESSGQTAIEAPGLERQYDALVTGAVPDAAKLKVKGTSTVSWDGPQLQRGQRATLIVDVICTGVGLEDDTDADGYVKKTYRVHTTEAESVRAAEAWEADQFAAERLRQTGEPKAAGEPRAPLPDVTLYSAPAQLPAEQLQIGDQILAPGGRDGELHLVTQRLDSGDQQIVRLQLDGQEGSVLEMTADEQCKGVLMARDAHGNIAESDEPPRQAEEELVEEELVTEPVPANLQLLDADDAPDAGDLDWDDDPPAAA